MARIKPDTITIPALTKNNSSKSPLNTSYVSCNLRDKNDETYVYKDVMKRLLRLTYKEIYEINLHSEYNAQMKHINRCVCSSILITKDGARLLV